MQLCAKLSYKLATSQLLQEALDWEVNAFFGNSIILFIQLKVEESIFNSKFFILYFSINYTVIALNINLYHP